MKSRVLRDTREIIREEMVMRRRILNVLSEGNKTVPEVAEEIGCPADEIMFWMMGMRKYGYIEETDEVTDEGFYRYALTEKGREDGTQK